MTAVSSVASDFNYHCSKAVVIKGLMACKATFQGSALKSGCYNVTPTDYEVVISGQLGDFHLDWYKNWYATHSHTFHNGLLWAGTACLREFTNAVGMVVTNLEKRWAEQAQEQSCLLNRAMLEETSLKVNNARSILRTGSFRGKHKSSRRISFGKVRHLMVDVDRYRAIRCKKRVFDAEAQEEFVIGTYTYEPCYDQPEPVPRAADRADDRVKALKCEPRYMNSSDAKQIADRLKQMNKAWGLDDVWVDCYGRTSKFRATKTPEAPDRLEDAEAELNSWISLVSRT